MKFHRLVVVGSSGFVGCAVLRASTSLGIDSLGINRAKIDLSTRNAEQELAALLRKDDAVIFCAAEAPCKSLESLERNLNMVTCFIRAITQQSVRYLINVSSDAVYQDSTTPLIESSPTAPNNWHGAMHSAREALLNATGVPTMHLRPTLIYGSGDPHNGYGPNQFLSHARRGTNIELFGDGEERRDHVHIADVAAAAVEVVRIGATGSLNIASGETRSFREIAERVVELSPAEIHIITKPRNGPMPHGGYRPISIDKCSSLLPQYSPIPVMRGIEQELGLHG